MAMNIKSPFLQLLDEVSRDVEFESMRQGTRGSRDSTGTIAPTTPSPSETLQRELEFADFSIKDQIAGIQQWLEVHQPLLELLDQAMKNIIAKSEARLKRHELVQNIIFCVLGSVLGLVLPWLVSHL